MAFYAAHYIGTPVYDACDVIMIGDVRFDGATVYLVTVDAIWSFAFVVIGAAHGFVCPHVIVWHDFCLD